MNHSIERRIRLLLRASAVVLLTIGGSSPVAAETGELADSTGWIISADAAETWIGQKDAIVLDARERSHWSSGHVPGAMVVDWTTFTPKKKSNRGTLLESDAELEKRIRKLGVSNDSPVVVVGASDGGWGEAGRIVWMLRTLGHERAAWVDGGHEALADQGIEMTESSSTTEVGDFRIDRTDDWSVTRDTLRKVYRRDDVVLLDTREEREFDGATPYGESRGGHIPGAQHLHFQTLLRENGRLKPADEIREKLKALGATPDKRIITYCTGGVRSAWVASVLVDLGYPRVQNFAGSTWSWASASTETYPLETE